MAHTTLFLRDSAAAEKMQQLLTQHPYHIAEIPRGEYGQASKIFEEVEEFRDAHAQKSSVLELCELADVLGAIEAYTVKYFNVDIEMLLKMTYANKKAFENGHRK